MNRPPFRSGRVVVVLPDPASAPEADRTRIRGLPELLALAADALEGELGARPEVGSDPGRGPRWIVRLGGAEPAHHLDRRAALLVTEAPTIDGLVEAFSTLRELGRRDDGRWPVRDCSGVDELVDRIREAVADSWPSFHVRDVDWDAICARHAPVVRGAADPLEAAARWVAELGDAHTAVRPATPLGRLRYALRVDPDGAVFGEVPSGSSAGRAGVGEGWRLDGVDPRALLARTGASPHSRPWVAGNAAQSGPIGDVRRWSALGPAGRRASWEEACPGPFDPPLVEAGEVDGLGWLRIVAFAPEVEPLLDAAFGGALAGLDRLVVDLRGNGGGHLATACRFRDRFVREPTTMGTIRTTLPGGALGPAVPIVASPSASPFRGRVTFLTDERTYSASEDALLGLQGLPHVEVVGRPSGGGSGRVRRVRLLAGAVLTVSTALTWDRRQRLVEGRGIPVDRALSGPADVATWCRTHRSTLVR